MAGDTDNTSVWSEADVYIGSLTATNPTGNAAFTLTDGTVTTTEWDLVGLLDGSAGFGEQQSLDSTDHSAWGVGVIATTRRNFKLTRTFTALEDNETVMGLIYDASGVTFTDEDYTGTLKVRDSAEKFKIAFELRDGVKVRRMISANYAQIEEVGEVTESEEGIQSRPVTVGIYPNGDGELWVTFKGDAAA